MNTAVRAILFDMGGTLRRRKPLSPAEKLAHIHQIQEKIGSTVEAEAFAAMLSQRAAEYARWAQRTLLEVGEEELWTRWLLPDLPATQIAPLALELNRHWRATAGEYRVLPETPGTILALYRRGYRIGLVSNTTSSVEAPQLLEALQIGGCFDAVVLSCVVGKRKPGAEILLEGARRMGVEARHCAYVGDRSDRDVAAARAAGFACTVIHRDPDNPHSPGDDPTLAPDHVIDNLQEMLALFPALPVAGQAEAPIYDASLSTMWGVKKFACLEDAFIAAGRLGFARVEINHQVGPEQLQGIDLGSYRFSSIHEPCPAVISSGELKQRDLLISSPDEQRRRAGVDSIRNSIELARRVGASLVVVHCGQIQADSAPEFELRALYDAGQYGSEEYRQKLARFMAQRAAMAPPCLEALRRSIIELLEIARPGDIRLGLENRYHIFDLPSPDEMEMLLGLGEPQRLGFLFDIGHAVTLERLGLYPLEEWLQRFGARILGVHLHDVIGLVDHRAPGLGDVDFRPLAPWLKDDTIRTLELHHSNTPEQIRAGLQVLADAGCIRRTK